MKEKIDLKRCSRAMVDLVVEGSPEGSVRQKAIDDAIAWIQKDGVGALAVEYIGVKNYAQFGDQREDHGYCYGPKHGTIVFQIGRVRRSVATVGSELGSDHVYLLEAVRDFGVIEGPEEPRRHGLGGTYRPSLNLCDAIERVTGLSTRLEHLTSALSKGEVESHEAKS